MRSAAAAIRATLPVYACAVSVLAHELGTTRVSIVLHEGRTYSIDVVTDAAALIEKLEASNGQSPVVDTRPDRLQARLARFDETFRRRVTLKFDAAEVRPEITYAVSPGADGGSSPIATIRLTGQVPTGAAHVAWSYAWTFASYAVTMRSAAVENPTTEWLEGGQSSAPCALMTRAP